MLKFSRIIFGGLSLYSVVSFGNCLNLLPALISSPDIPIRFAIEHNDDRVLFAREPVWDRKRFENVLGKLEQNAGNPVVFDGLFESYEKATGTSVEVNLGLQLNDYLKAKGIVAGELSVLNGGAQGVLFTHPKLGNSAIKVMTSTLQNCAHCGFSAQSKISLGNGRHSVADIGLAHSELDGLRADPEFDPAHTGVLLNQQDRQRKAYRAQAKQALHLAYKLMVPGLIAEQAKLKFFDFARVQFIGNGFFVREYYPDSEAEGFATGASLLVEDNFTNSDLNAALDAVRSDFPVLGELVPTLFSQAPSFFVSKTLYLSTRGQRPRLYVIYDLD